MPLFIDAHQDMAFNHLLYHRDYRLSVHATRQKEINSRAVRENGETLLGWPEYQQAQTAVIFGTLFIQNAENSKPDDDPPGYRTAQEAHALYQREVDYYHQLSDENPQMFHLIKSQADLHLVLHAWQEKAADYPRVSHPVGLVMLMEGAEGLAEPAEMEFWWQQGVRLAGPVWGGGRFCGSNSRSGGFDQEGKQLLEIMADLGMGLDCSHMNTESALYALDHYEGTILASHANALALLPHFPNQRHFTDDIIRAMITRDGVIGTMPVNMFLQVDWKKGDDKQRVTLDDLIHHIDYICQMAGNTRHAALGTDFDGGFGLDSVPYEIDTIAEIQLVAQRLAQRGYTEQDIDAIFYGNWLRMLERILPLHD